MNITSRALAVSLLLGAFFLAAQMANAQTKSAQIKSPPPATATRPSTPDQTSVPNTSPPASSKQTTGRVDQDPTVKQMNQKEKGKVERAGK